MHEYHLNEQKTTKKLDSNTNRQPSNSRNQTRAEKTESGFHTNITATQRSSGLSKYINDDNYFINLDQTNNIKPSLNRELSPETNPGKSKLIEERRSPGNLRFFSMHPKDKEVIPRRITDTKGFNVEDSDRTIDKHQDVIPDDVAKINDGEHPITDFKALDNINYIYIEGKSFSYKKSEHSGSKKHTNQLRTEERVISRPHSKEELFQNFPHSLNSKRHLSVSRSRSNTPKVQQLPAGRANNIKSMASVTQRSNSFWDKNRQHNRSQSPNVTLDYYNLTGNSISVGNMIRNPTNVTNDIKSQTSPIITTNYIAREVSQPANSNSYSNYFFIKVSDGVIEPNINNNVIRITDQGQSMGNTSSEYIEKFDLNMNHNVVKQRAFTHEIEPHHEFTERSASKDYKIDDTGHQTYSKANTKLSFSIYPNLSRFIKNDDNSMNSKLNYTAPENIEEVQVSEFTNINSRRVETSHNVRANTIKTNQKDSKQAERSQFTNGSRSNSRNRRKVETVPVVTNVSSNIEKTKKETENKTFTNETDLQSHNTNKVMQNNHVRIEDRRIERVNTTRTDYKHEDREDKNETEKVIRSNTEIKHDKRSKDTEIRWADHINHKATDNKSFSNKSFTNSSKNNISQQGDIKKTSKHSEDYNFNLEEEVNEVVDKQKKTEQRSISNNEKQQVNNVFREQRDSKKMSKGSSIPSNNTNTQKEKSAQNLKPKVLDVRIDIKEEVKNEITYNNDVFDFTNHYENKTKRQISQVAPKSNFEHKINKKVSAQTDKQDSKPFEYVPAERPEIKHNFSIDVNDLIRDNKKSSVNKPKFRNYSDKHGENFEERRESLRPKNTSPKELDHNKITDLQEFKEQNINIIEEEIHIEKRPKKIEKRVIEKKVQEIVPDIIKKPTINQILNEEPMIKRETKIEPKNKVVDHQRKVEDKNRSLIARLKNKIQDQFHSYLDDDEESEKDFELKAKQGFDEKREDIKHKTALTETQKAKKTDKQVIVKSHSLSDLNTKIQPIAQKRPDNEKQMITRVKRASIVNYSDSKKLAYNEIVSVTDTLLKRLNMDKVYECYLIDDNKKELIILLDRTKFSNRDLHLSLTDEHRIFMKKFSYSAIKHQPKVKRNKSQSPDFQKSDILDKILDFSVVVGRTSNNKPIKRNLYFKEIPNPITPLQKYCLLS